MKNKCTLECLFCISLFLFIDKIYSQKVVRYDLYVKDTVVNFTGNKKRAIAVNGQIPMPTLVFTEGDTAEIYVYNQLKNESTSLHWHGLILPNKEDGVPYLTQMPIEPNTVHIYRFPIIQNGTHWYHSHSGLQEQIGMYGSLILNKKNTDSSFRKEIDDLPSIPIIISDWTDYNPEYIHKLLHNASDWFAIKKGATQDYLESIKLGCFKTKIVNEWKRMMAMDVSDVYYDRFLINGKNEISKKEFKSGDKVRLRISNGSSSTYFWLNYAGGKITVVASDGNDVEPVEVDRLLIAVSETYDIIVTVPEDSTSFEFSATSEDRIGFASLFIGSGTKKLTQKLPKLLYFEGMKMMNSMMKMNGDLDDMGMKMSLNKMDMNSVMYDELKSQPNIKTLNYSMLKSTKLSSIDSTNTFKELYLELNGNMNRYIWSLNNNVLSEADKILIKKGEKVRMILYNNSMMRHPMHMHGHDFVIINKHGKYAPLKNVVDLMPMETDTIEFKANNEGDWFFHCHILYHMMVGMGRIFSYENQKNNPLIPNKKLAQRKLYADDRGVHFMFENDFATNGNDGMVMLQNTRCNLTTEWRLGYDHHHGYEIETHLERYVDKMQWFRIFVGFDWRYRKLHKGEVEKNLLNQINTKDDRKQFSLGFIYTLPMLINFQTELYHDGNIRIQMMREGIPLTKRLRMDFMVNTDKEYMLSFSYILSNHLNIGTHYDSDMKLGFGIRLIY